jgi:N-6 DNA Methylase
MASGISGSLVPPGFLAEVFPSVCAARLADARRRAPLTSLARWWRRVTRQLGPASASRTVFDIAGLPLVELLGYEVQHAEAVGHTYIGVISAGEVRVVLLVLPWTESPERRWRDVQRAARVAGARWALAITGGRLHLLDAAESWSRRSLDFELAQVMLDERAVLTLWTLTNAATMPSSLDEIIGAANEHGAQVCASLGEGVLASLTALVAALHQPGRTPSASSSHATFDQALTLVYRILFLLFAEARGLVPTWHRVYRDAYTIDAMCRRSVLSERPSGLWEALQAISRLAHAGCRAGDLQVTAFNGRLFSPRHAPLVHRGRIPDTVVRDAVLALATRPTSRGRRRIAYGDLGVEQLGAVYEHLLEYEPTPDDASGPVVLSRTSQIRKATGSFYTPRGITEFLVRRTLQPLVDGRSAEEILALRVVDPAMGSGAFLVAACRFLARAVERARLAEGAWRADEVGREQRADLRRTVAQRCLYGVDLNPTAVQLARLSLWLTTLAVDRPLTFLDHHLATGDSLIGATLEDLARPLAAVRPRSAAASAALPLFDDSAAKEMAAVLPDRYRIANDAGDSLAAVRDKERTLDDLAAPGTPLHKWKAAADLWCAKFFWPGAGLTPGLYADLLSTLLGQGAVLPERRSRELLERAATIAREQHTFHWQLEFPEVFFDRDGRRRADGGFDAVLGNPPWEVLRSDSGPDDARVAGRAAHQKRLRFFRGSGAYHLQSSGHANQYQLFVERALHILRPGGRMGLLLPSGLATDHGCAGIRRALLDRCRIDRLYGFNNRAAIFPIHRDMRFLLITATNGEPSVRVVCRFGLQDPAWLDGLPDDSRDDGHDARPIVLTRALLDAWDHERLSIPELDDPRDLDILSHILATVPKLGDATGWHARFGRELNATDDRDHFQPRDRRSGGALPIIEGKHLEPFRISVERASHTLSRTAATELLDPATTFGRRRLAYRDVASATNRLTLIAAILPQATVSTHTVFCLKTKLDDAAQYCLLALLNSLVANYLVRLQVTTHVTASLMARLPVPVPPSSSAERRTLIACARRLEASGIEGRIDSYVELNRIAARLYGLSQAQYEHVVSTFTLLPPELRERCVSTDKGQVGRVRQVGRVGDSTD